MKPTGNLFSKIFSLLINLEAIATERSDNWLYSFATASSDLNAKLNALKSRHWRSNQNLSNFSLLGRRQCLSLAFAATLQMHLVDKLLASQKSLFLHSKRKITSLQSCGEG